MRQIHFLAIVLLALITLSSCSKRLTPFTENVYEEFDWTDRELEKIQFYLSEDIILHRKLRAEDSKIDNGKIRVIDGSRVEEIVFKKGTPGVFMFSPKKNRLAISFEDGGEEKYLMFGPNPKTGGRFVLLAKEWNQRSGKVTYNSQTYNTTYESAYANLLVDLKKARNINYKSRTAKGRTVE